MGLEAELRTRTSTYKTARVGRLFLVRWTAPPDVASAKAALQEAQRFARSMPEVLYAGISDEAAGTPDEPTQRVMVQLAVELLEFVSEFHLVIAGSGVRSLAARSLFRGMLVAARLGHRVLGFDTVGLGRKAHMHSSVEELTRVVGPAMTHAPKDLYAALERAGLT